MPSSDPPIPFARWGLLATALLLAATLVATAVSGYMGVRSLKDVLIQGQVELHLRAFHEVHRGRGPRLDEADLSQIVSAHHDQGLRYLGVVQPFGDIIESGVRVGPAPIGEAKRGRRYEWVSDERVRVVDGVSNTGGARGSSGPDAMRRDGNREGGRFGPRPPDPPLGHEGPPPGSIDARRGMPLTFVEFIPTIALQAEQRALVTLLASSVAALALAVAAWIFWRQGVLADAQREYNDRQARLASLGEMSAVMAHEIRNPLASLKGHAQLLAEQLEPGSRQQNKVHRVIHDAVRLERLSTGLLDFVRSGRVKLEDIDLMGHLEESVAFAPNAVIHGERCPARWQVDRVRFRQVVVNLVQNAVQASPPSEAVEIEAWEDGGRLCLEVRDHGKGIPPGQEEAIFEPFQTDRTQGTGLGLAVSRRIIEMHGGTLVASNHDGGGAVFRVEIPRGK